MATGGSVLWFWPDGLGFHIFTLSSWSLICHCQTRYFLFCTHFVIRKVSCTSPCLLLDFWCSLNCGDPLISLQPVSVNELITAASAKRVVPFPWSIVFWCPGTTRTEERGKETTGDPLAVSTHNPLLPLLPRKKGKKKKKHCPTSLHASVPVVPRLTKIWPPRTQTTALVLTTAGSVRKVRSTVLLNLSRSCRDRAATCISRSPNYRVKNMLLPSCYRPWYW